MTRNNPICKMIALLHRKCEHVEAEVPLKLREASHRLGNEVMILKRVADELRGSADALSDLAEHMGVDIQ